MAQNTKTLTALLGIVFYVSACAPIPHDEIYAPKVSGVIYDGNIPLKNTKVYLGTSEDDQCKTNQTVAETDNLGQFEIGPIKERRYIVWLIGDVGIWWAWNMCIDLSDHRVPIMRVSGAKHGPNFRVKCNVARKLEPFKKSGQSVSGYCETVQP